MDALQNDFWRPSTGFRGLTHRPAHRGDETAVHVAVI